MMADARAADVVLVDAIDRLSRLPRMDWEALRSEIESKGVLAVAVELPTSHEPMTAGGRPGGY